MVQKTPYVPANLPDMSNLFSWGLRISDFREWFFISGLADMADDLSGALFPGDPVAQTRAVLQRMDQFIEEAGYTRENIVRMEWTFRKDVSEEDYPAIYQLWEEFLKPLAVKPTGGTLRIVERLATADIMVEYELWLAR